MPTFPFWLRLLALLLVLGVLALWDRRRHGALATRGPDYGFLLACAALGAGFAVLNDLALSVQISPAYFELAKGIEPGEGFLGRVAELATHAGFLAGALVGGALLLANQPRPGARTLRYAELLAWALLPLGLALAGAPVGALLADGLEPAWLRESTSFLSPERARGLRLVWGLHAGLYAGGALGTLSAVVLARRARFSRAGTAPAPAR